MEKFFINVTEFESLCNVLLKKIPKNKKYVFGVPRGGILISQYISLNSKLKHIDSLSGIPKQEIIVVDDLIDSGKTKERYKDYDFFVLIDKQKDKKFKGTWIEFFYEKTDSDDEDIIVRMLQRIGEDPTREGLKDTPKRVIKMWDEIYKGYNSNEEPEITVFSNGKDGLTYSEMIIDTGTFHSTCEHHMVPFFGKYVFAYIPNKKIIGLSKVARIIDYHSAKLQVQERLTNEIVESIEKIVQPKGIALYLEGEHLCKSMRGIKKKGLMKTICVKGILKTNKSKRNEFFSHLPRQKITHE